MVEIRPARVADLARIIEILEGYNMGHFGHAERPAMPKIEHFMVAEEQGVVVGCCAYLLYDESEIAVRADEAETGSLAVSAEYRGKGVGEALQAARMHQLLDLGIETLFTETDRPQTIAWYIRKFGYRRLSSRPKKFRDFGDPDVDTFTLLAVDLRKWRQGLLE